MSEKDLPSGSDESDVDFVPDNENHESLSEESGSSGREESFDETEKKNGKKSRKRRKARKEPEEQGEPAAKKKDINVDALWAEFKEDVSQKKVDTNSSVIKQDQKDVEAENKNTGSTDCIVKKPPVSSILGKSFPSSVNNKSAAKGGLASVLNKLGKKDKLSTLEKSKLDWNRFKQSEGIDEEIKTFNKGKDGYLEKQDFLQRTDLRQFEIEKQLRATKKTFR